MPKTSGTAALMAIVTMLLASCGGGGSSAPAMPPATGTTDAQRVAAATATAAGNPLCSAAALGPYYWEIGNKDGPLAAGKGGGGTVDADTMMSIASSAKWLFSAYVIETLGDIPANVPFLNFTSGYSNFDNMLCAANDTVAACMNGGLDAAEAAERVFHYDGGHMQQLAIDIGLGSLLRDGLGSEVRAVLGSDVALTYGVPQLAGGVRTSARSYAAFLRKLLVGSAEPLRLGPLLGSHAVCTRPSSTCNASAAVVVPAAWHYSLGHWVEDDPAADSSDNFAYSSTGMFGFYPWVDIDRNLYGIVAREDLGLTVGTANWSVQCGQAIRHAWKTGIAQ